MHNTFREDALHELQRLRKENSLLRSALSEEQQAEVTRRQHLENLRLLVDTALDAVVMVDENRLITEWNGQAEAVFGWTRAEALGMCVTDTILPRQRGQTGLRGFNRFLKTGEHRYINQRVEIVCRRRDGTLFPAEVAFSPIPLNGSPCFSAFIHDITRRKQMQQMLIEREAMYRRAIATANGVVYQLDFRHNAYTYLDEQIERLIGYTVEEMTPSLWTKIGKVFQCRGYMAGMTIQEASRLFRSGEIPVWTADYFCYNKQGERRWLFDSSIPLRDAEGVVYGCLGILQDVTERMMLQEHLLQSQKLESLGRLAGGIAHDFNNLLTAIMGYSELLQSRIPPESDLYHDVESIAYAGSRAAELTRQLLAFARKQIIAPKQINLNDLIVDTDRILRRLIGEHIELVTVPSVQLATVLADAGQIQQVLLNLAVNARDAMPQGGTLTITTANVSLTEEDTRQMHEIKPGDYVLLTVSDNGSGIAPEIQPHIFEPFFTTKETGKGIGLGLASCHGIIKQNEGHIFLDSEPDRGTAFHIYLPCVRDSVAPVPARPAILSRGKGTLLVVEDNTLVRRFVQETLAQNGYTVLEAASGQEALRLARTFADRLHLLITDVVMPRMSGVELAKRLQKIRPEVQVLFMSGHAEDNSIPNREMFGGAAFVQKPFSSSDLIRAVGSALAAEPTQTAEPTEC